MVTMVPSPTRTRWAPAGGWHIAQPSRRARRARLRPRHRGDTRAEVMDWSWERFRGLSSTSTELRVTFTTSSKPLRHIAMVHTSPTSWSSHGVAAPPAAGCSSQPSNGCSHNPSPRRDWSAVNRRGISSPWTELIARDSTLQLAESCRWIDGSGDSHQGAGRVRPNTGGVQHSMPPPA
jgi:hypothetical protein